MDPNTNSTNTNNTNTNTPNITVNINPNIPSKSNYTVHVAGPTELPSSHHYSTFKASGVPRRLLFRVQQGGQWVDFPAGILRLAKAAIGRSKKASVEVKMNGQHFVVDFLHMFLLNLGTGARAPMAWVDDQGKFCFPAEPEADSGGEMKVRVEVDVKGPGLPASNGKEEASASSTTPVASPELPSSPTFAALANVIPQADMNLVIANYGLLKEKRISGNEFSKLMRLIVGESLFETTVSKIPSEETATANSKRQKRG